VITTSVHSINKGKICVLKLKLTNLNLCHWKALILSLSNGVKIAFLKDFINKLLIFKV